VFTGLVQAVGLVREITPGLAGSRILIDSADLAAPLLVLRVPPRVRRLMLASPAGRLLGRPFRVLAVWAGLIYLWFVPSLHRQAIPGGVVPPGRSHRRLGITFPVAGTSA